MGAEYLFLSYRAECSAAKAELNPKIITRADGAFTPSVSLVVLLLFNFCGRTGFGKLLLDSLSVNLGNTFLDRFRCSVHQIFCFLQA